MRDKPMSLLQEAYHASIADLSISRAQKIRMINLMCMHGHYEAICNSLKSEGLCLLPHQIQSLEHMDNLPKRSQRKLH